MRIDTLDVLRGVAVISMIFYHFFWDMGFFGHIDLLYLTTGFGLFLAQIIGASFIFISGISLSISRLSNNSIKKFWFRFIKLFLISSLISLVTFTFDRNSFIFFGIIHFLTISSLIGFLIIKMNNQLISIGAFILTLFLYFSGLKFNFPPYLSWIGLNTNIPNTNDFYPIFPWINFYILGCFFGQFFASNIINLPTLLRNNSDRHNSITYRLLIFSGRKSLVIYILHQPIFFSLFLIFNRIWS